MEYKLWNNGTPLYNQEFGQPEPTITSYLCEDKKDNGCIIVIPGGAYFNRAPHEGEPIAKMLNDNGISSFVLNYRVAPYKHPAQLYDVQRAIRFVRYNADKFGINPKKIGVLGFSAGGHLASTACTLYDYGNSCGDEIDKVSCRPDAGILCYAVISMVKYTHEYSKMNLCGKEDNPLLHSSLSGELCVKSDCPPLFLWHTASDSSVAVENSLNMALALSEKKIPYELHVFPEGRHGLGLAPDNPHVAQWASLLVNWLKFNNFVI